MPLEPNAQTSEAERAELERVVDALTKWPRLSHLLRYMGEKLVAGDSEHLNEYNIATEVLGRSKTVFNAAEDAIARVETHRLRKRLAEFYETEGRDHLIQVTLPAGSYVPVFIHKPVDKPSVVPGVSGQVAISETVGRQKGTSHWLVSNWKYLAFAAVLVLVALGLYVYRHRIANSTHSIIGSSQAPTSASSAPQSGASSSTIRILAGYSGPPRTDSAGKVWRSDEYFSEGAAWQRSPGFIARTSDPFLFEQSRTGDFSYRIPLKPGIYELHLYFSTPVQYFEAVHTFNVWINGQWALRGFDINSDADGEDVADERVFRDVSPGNDGFLRIRFAGATGPPALNAIEILPGLPHAQLPIRLVMQSTPFTDSKGQFWQPDNYFLNGRLSSVMHPLAGSPDPDLFSEERYGHFSYAIPTIPGDQYTVILHFVEFYFGSGTSADGGAGSRLFKVMCNGQTLLDNFDVYSEAGSLHEISKTFYHLKPSAEGKLNLTFEPIANNATVSGIEVLDESQ